MSQFQAILDWEPRALSYTRKVLVLPHFHYLILLARLNFKSLLQRKSYYFPASEIWIDYQVNSMKVTLFSVYATHWPQQSIRLIL